MNKNKTKKCCAGCGRKAAECWTMPCLELEAAMATLDPREVNKWCEASGAPFRAELNIADADGSVTTRR